MALVICALAYAAHPSHRPIGFASRSQPTDCVNHLRIIDGAKEQFAIEHGKTNGANGPLVPEAPFFDVAGSPPRGPMGIRQSDGGSEPCNAWFL